MSINIENHLYSPPSNRRPEVDTLPFHMAADSSFVSSSLTRIVERGREVQAQKNRKQAQEVILAAAYELWGYTQNASYLPTFREMAGNKTVIYHRGDQAREINVSRQIEAHRSLFDGANEVTIPAELEIEAAELASPLPVVVSGEHMIIGATSEWIDVDYISKKAGDSEDVYTVYRQVPKLTPAGELVPFTPGVEPIVIPNLCLLSEREKSYTLEDATYIKSAMDQYLLPIGKQVKKVRDYNSDIAREDRKKTLNPGLFVDILQ